jgi:hypothetical protein
MFVLEFTYVAHYYKIHIRHEKSISVPEVVLSAWHTDKDGVDQTQSGAHPEFFHVKGGVLT